MARRRPDSSWPPPPRPPETCALCEREHPALTTHHLRPRSQGGGNGETAELCPECHGHVHARLDEASLAREYASVDTLAAHPEIARFVAWVRRQPPSRRHRSRRARL